MENQDQIFPSDVEIKEEPQTSHDDVRAIGSDVTTPGDDAVPFVVNIKTESDDAQAQNDDPANPSDDVHTRNSDVQPRTGDVRTPIDDVMNPDSDEPESSDDEDKILPHHVAMEMFRDGVAELIVGDPLLSDLPTRITPEEVTSQIALEHGQAITVYVRRADDVVLPVVVVQDGTVLDLKQAIQRHVTLKQIREEGTTHISWRHVWRRHWLYYSGQKLTEDRKLIKEYGIRNKDEVSFIKRLQQR